jgi:hypothetical protein
MRNPRITLRPSIIANTVSIAQISLHYQYAGSRLSFRYIKSHMLGLRKPFLYTNTAHKRAGLPNTLLRILKSQDTKKDGHVPYVEALKTHKHP